ncbi:tyrosine-protein phosphatase [Paraferrimonas sedimenticola]|uniref:protein-tyrosine-phosphatase n=1 Tax=Paraferrimonas sedimenticola TaxID=375674 RepID=A0AA37S0B1_9GAMM|nr:tyrosine-protein phosphatase [Paraferrimonas sedimenticola]GLP98028.1 protein-tyrosine-phosphatase [Paraferrimonas sedimenticola]
MAHPFDSMPLPEGGNLLFTPCPGTKDEDLDASLARLKNAGAVAVVSTTPGAEMAKLQVAALPQSCESLGLAWYHFPISDDSAPSESFEQAFAASKAEVLALLQQGGTIAIHCKGGSGRTGLLAALLRLALGHDPKVVKAEVQALRPKALVHPVQLGYFESQLG